MIELPWVVGGLIIGLLISTVATPPTRKVAKVPQPHDSGIYHTESGCVRFETDEVPCVQEPDSFNLLASLSKK